MVEIEFPNQLSDASATNQRLEGQLAHLRHTINTIMKSHPTQGEGGGESVGEDETQGTDVGEDGGEGEGTAPASSARALGESLTRHVRQLEQRLQDTIAETKSLTGRHSDQMNEHKMQRTQLEQQNSNLTARVSECGRRCSRPYP